MLIGVSILQKGTSNGTITDMDGNYTLKVSGEQPVLVFSYIGYKTLEIPGNKPTLNVTMSDDTQVIDEVVVTALGIKREKKMLGYAVQEIKSDQLNKTGDPSVTSALQGKVAGLQMNTAGTGLGGSTKITIRGNSSLSDNNQPLWIIDGVPFSDNNSSDASYYGGVDRGGASVDINPDDIETISVLKGPNAAALYGSRAGNGVILITTKKGSKKEGFGVRYSGNFTWSTVAETLKMQERYGQGTDGVYNKAASSSWGSELDGHMVEAWNGEQRAYSKYGNKLEDYFNTGFAHNHNVSISNVTDKSHFRVSFGSSNNKGLFPNEKLDKINIDLNAGAEMNQYLSMEGKVSLSRTKAEDRPYFGSYGVIAQLIGIPHNVSLDDLKNYSTGVQHIGIPTNDIDKTVEFYHKLGFETAFETVNEEANEKVVFLKLGTLVVETYENHAAKMEHGAIDHVALDVRDIEEIFQYINEVGLNSTQDTIHFLPFWENGVKFFTIEGPNKEKVEFSQYL